MDENIESLNDIARISMKYQDLYNIIIELTNYCNWRCKYCFVEKQELNKLSKDKVCAVLKELKESGAYHVTFTGGEIFTYEECIEVIVFARKLGFEVEILSNASLINEELVKKLADIHIEKFSCSIFSMNEDIHDKFVESKNSLQKVKHNLSLLKLYNIPVEVKVGVTNYNKYEWNQIEEYCKENGFNFIVDCTIRPSNEGDNSIVDYALSKDELTELINILDKKQDITKFDNCDENFICSDSRCSLTIKANGDVCPCVNWPYIVGNIYESSIVEIWNSKKFKKIRSLTWRDTIKCHECNIKEYCQRCPGIAMLQNNNILEKAPINCTMAEARKIARVNYD